MQFTRRNVLRAGTAVMAAAVGPVKWFGLVFPELAGAATLTDFRQSTFTPYVNTKFRVTVGSSYVDLVLAHIVPGIKVDAAGECFSLLFTGPRTKPFTQDTYTVTHASLGTFSIFIAPVDLPGKTLQYEAVFNRP